MLMVKVVVVMPSVAVTVTVSVPVKPSAGVYSTLPALDPLVMALKLPPPLAVPNVRLMGPAAPLAAASGSST